MARVKMYEVTISVRSEATFKLRALSTIDAQNIAKAKLRAKQVSLSATEEEVEYARINKCEEIK